MKLPMLFIILMFWTHWSFSQTNAALQQHVEKLEGVSFVYTYTNNSAIQISFASEELTYKWIEGPNKSKPTKSYPYKSRLLSSNRFYVNWHERDFKNFISLVFDFNTMEALSSVIVRYQNEDPRTTFDSAVISEFVNSSPDATLPFSKIPDYELQYNPGNIIKRMVDGLGYRYYWATEGLTGNDLEYRPTEEARSTRETLEHIYGLSESILNTARNQANIRSGNLSEIDFKDLRKMTLENLSLASALFENKNQEEISALNIIFESNGQRSVFPFWHLINGQISDAIYHTGQLVSFRRTSGNPINSKVNVFLGTTAKQ